MQESRIRVGDNFVNVIRVRTNITDNPNLEREDATIIDSGSNILRISKY